MHGESTPDRHLLAIAGPDRVAFLQGLVTNEITASSQGLIYAALLSPQGKYLADFFLAPQPDVILLDVHSALADALTRRLTMYRLRAKVTLGTSPLHIQRGLGPMPPGAHPDPRHPSLGWRLYGPHPGHAPKIDWNAIRVAACIPETTAELIPDDTYILEAGFERLHGVDFRKGCYVGQEVTARMKHKTELRKGLATVRIAGSAPPGTTITANGKPVGTLHTQSGDQAIAYLRFDRADAPMQAASAEIYWNGAEN